MRRYADTFFRYWTFALLPVLLLPVGAFLLLKSTPTYYGVANIWVDQSSLSHLTYVDQGVPPAQNMASYLGQLLLSPSFDWNVVRRTQHYLRTIPAGINPQTFAASDLSTNAQAVAEGPNLVTITYSTRDFATGARIVHSILNEAAIETVRLNQQQAAKNAVYYQGQLNSARTRYAAAAQQLGRYMSANGITSNELGLRQLSDPKLAVLYQAVQSAQTDETNAQQQLATTRTQETQAQQNTFRIIDQPATKITITSRKKQLTSLAIPLILGLLLGCGFIVARTLRDRTLRYADEVPDLLGLPVLAVVPFSPALAVAGRRRVSARPSSLAGEG